MVTMDTTVTEVTELQPQPEQFQETITLEKKPEAVEMQIEMPEQKTETTTMVIEQEPAPQVIIKGARYLTFLIHKNIWKLLFYVSLQSLIVFH